MHHIQQWDVGGAISRCLSDAGPLLSRGRSAHPPRARLRWALAGAAVATMAACGEGRTPAEPDPRVPDQSLVAQSELAGSADIHVAVPDLTLPTGYLQICKTAGVGVSGTFDFALSGEAVVDQTISVEVGTCSRRIQVNVGTVTVAEVARPGFMVQSIAFSGLGASLSRSTVSTATASVAVLAGGVSATTVVQFKNVLKPFPLRLCKVAGAGVAAGASFNFTVATGSTTANVRVSAGASATGNCITVGSYPIGTVVRITEAAIAGTSVASISLSGGATGTVDLAARTVTVTTGLDANVVVFTNIGEGGTVRLCKVGVDAAIGASFDFLSSITGSAAVRLTAGPGPTGDCITLGGSLGIGATVRITEAPAPGYLLSNIAFSGAGSPNYATGTATVTVGVGVNTVIFTNLPALRLCTQTYVQYKDGEAVVGTTLQFGRLTRSQYVSASGEVRLRVGDQWLSAAGLDGLLELALSADGAATLQRHLIAAELNVIAMGTAAVPPSVTQAIATANALLAGGVSPLELTQALNLAATLEAFNSSQPCG